MRNHKFFVSALLLSICLVTNLLAQQLAPTTIENIRLQSTDLPTGFILFEERIEKPGELPGEQIIQQWKFDSSINKLVLVENERNQSKDQINGYLSQLWYRGEKKGQKDKIEIEITICPLKIQIDSTICYYTTQAFSVPYTISESPIIGDRSWMPDTINSGKDSFSLIFQKLNVVVRLYVRIQKADHDNLVNITKSIGDAIENKITF